MAMASNNSSNGTAGFLSSTTSTGNIAISTTRSTTMASSPSAPLPPDIILDPINPSSLEDSSSSPTTVIPSASTIPPPPSASQSRGQSAPVPTSRTVPTGPPPNLSSSQSAGVSTVPSITPSPQPPPPPPPSPPPAASTPASTSIPSSNTSAQTPTSVTSSFLASSAVSSPTSSSSTTPISSSLPKVTPTASSGTFMAASSQISLKSSATTSTATTSSISSTTTNPPEALGEPPTVQADSSAGSSRNVAIIAAPVAVGTVLVLMLLLFCCWYRRRNWLPGAYHCRNRSDDTEMSNMSNDNQVEPKVVPQERQMSPIHLPGTPPKFEEVSESKAWSVESTFAPGTLPGLDQHSPKENPLRSHPPPRNPNRQSASPTIILSDPVEPLDVMRSSKTAQAKRNPFSAHQGTTVEEDIAWPLPPQTKRRDRGNGIVGPSGPRPLVSSSAVPFVPNGSEHRISSSSPFDDYPDGSVSDYSITMADDRPRNSMLTVPERRQINDDGISEMSVSSRPSNRRSRLNHRTSDEISVVSSLGEYDENRRRQEAREGGGAFTALPQESD